MKECTVCGMVKPLDNFYNYKKAADGKQCRCKQCDTDARHKYRRLHPVRYRASRRAAMLKWRYSLTQEQYKELLFRQENKCACCGIEENKSGYNGRAGDNNFVVDHCHETGRIRGLLCANCNRGIGLLGDSTETILKAYNYLKRTEMEVH